MAIRSNDNRDSSGRRVRSEPKSKPAPKAESKPKYVAGEIVCDDDDVRSHRVQSRREWTDAVQAKGGEGRTYGAATNKLYGKVFCNGTPMGKPDQWSAEDQKRIAVGHKVSKQYIEEGDDGHYGIISSVERGGSDANARCNEDGVDSWFSKLCRAVASPNTTWDEKPEKQIVERRQTDADENDSHLTPGQKMLKQQRAKQSESSESGGFIGAIFGNGKTVWDEEQYSSPSQSVEPAEESKGFWESVFNPKNYWDD